jgi:general nucleoside transport system permease protein
MRDEIVLELGSVAIGQRVLVRLKPLAPLLGGMLALLLGGILLLVSGANPLQAYRVMWVGAFGGGRPLTETLLRATPLLIIGLGMTIAFRCRVWNIGAEGQYYMGALGSSIVALTLPDLAGYWLIPLMLMAGVLGGAIWSGIAGLLYLKRGVNLIIGTLMLNYIGILLVQYAARVPLQQPEGFLPESAQFSVNAQISTLLGTRLHWGMVLAVLLVAAVYILLWRTPLGLQFRAVGSRLSVARCAGIDTSRSILMAMMMSGGLAGLAGTIEVSYTYTRLKGDISDNFGFSGILVALLGQLHPVGVLVAALLFSALMVGAQSLNVVLQIPSAIAQVIQAIVVLFVLAGHAISQRES